MSLNDANGESLFRQRHQPEPATMTTTVRAKFRCVSITENEGSLKSARLQPVTSGSPENAEFYKWTPGGSMELSTMTPAAAALFVPGKEFYVDFTPA